MNLNTQQNEIIKLICLGHSNKKISEELELSPSQLKTQLKYIYTKYDLLYEKNARIRLVIEHCRST